MLNGGDVDFNMLRRLARSASNIKGKGVIVARKRRMTKGRLQEICRKGVTGMSPELGVEAVEGGDIVELNKPYLITNVEDVTTEVSFYQGIRVEMTQVNGNIGSLMLWKRPKVGTKSKLGVFISLLGSNTDMWLNKWVVFTKWEKNNRILLPYTPPAKAVAETAELSGAIKATGKAKK